MAYLASVVPHATDSNKLRLTFSAALNTATVLAANFSLSPSVTVQHAGVVAGSGNTQVDLHFGTDLANDADIAMWRFDETAGATATDIGPGGYTLTDNGLCAVNNNGLYKSARTYTGVNTSSMQSAATTGPRTALLGEWTIDVLLSRDSTQPDGLGNFLSFCGASSALQAENVLANFHITPTGGIQLDWENGAGVSVVPLSPIANSFASGSARLLTFTKALSGALYVVSVFINGKLLTTSVPVANADGGTSGSMRWTTGATANLTTNNKFKGVIDTIRAKTGVRTNDQIAAYAKDLLFPLTRGTTYTVTCTGVQDSLTNPIVGNDAVYVLQYLSVNSNATGESTSKEITAYNGVTQSFGGGLPSRVPILDLTAQRTAGSTIRIQSTNPLDSNAATTVPANWSISGPSVITVSSVSFTPGNSYLDLNVSGTFVSGAYSITTAPGTVNDIYGQYWTGSIPLNLVAGGAGGGSNFNSGLN